MPAHCFEVTAVVNDTWTGTHTTAARNKVKKLYQAFGKDVSPREATDFTVRQIDGGREGTLVMRLPVVEVSVDEIKNHITPLLDNAAIDSWVVRYHLCMNAERKPCEKWQVLATG